MHGHGSARAERVRSGVFWRNSESGCSNSNNLGLEYHDDVQCTDQANPLSNMIVSDRGGSRVPMFSHAEEDVDARLNRAGCCQLRSDVRDRFSPDRIILVVQGKDYMGGVL